MTDGAATTDFDLNLVRIFVLLYETRSVTVTARTVHVSERSERTMGTAAGLTAKP